LDVQNCQKPVLDGVVFTWYLPVNSAPRPKLANPVKKPSDPVAQQATFSTYKNRNTAKSLIGISPGGLTTYVSDCYGRSTSDRQIVERSTIKVEKGDSMMADKGFNVQDLFASQDVAVNIPAFFKKQNRIQGDVVLSDRRISSKRTHVERVIGLRKTYKILTHPLNHSETILSSDIVFICFMLANFRPCIVPKNSIILIKRFQSLS
jgi:hypothetical protein